MRQSYLNSPCLIVLLNGDIQMNNYGPNDYTKYQREPDQVRHSVSHMIAKGSEVKRTIEGLIGMLENQDAASYPDMLEKFAAISAVMTSFRKSGIPSMSIEDHGALMRSNVLVPQILTPIDDPKLIQTTECRVRAWDHSVVPDYLRTKPAPEIEQEESTLDSERMAKPADFVSRQISAYNKNIDACIAQITSIDRAVNQELADTRAQDNGEETRRLVRALMLGENMKPPKTSIPPHQAMPGLRR